MSVAAACSIGKMLAMVVEEPGRPLAARELPDPVPASGEILIRVHASAREG